MSGAGAIQAEEEQPDFNSVFSTRKPRDFGAGLASGAKSVAKGVLAGAIGLVAAPAIGAHQEGFKGFAKGAAAGLAGAVILPVTGVVVGTGQLVRGAVNTPEAIKQSSQGKQWDHAQRCWVDPPGDALVVDGQAQRAARQQWRRQQQRARGGAGGGGADGEAPADDFYELLGVDHDATPAEIKKQYYLLARRMHPDKNPGDPEANVRFQKLGEAYQVLGNEELRKRYDAHGSEGLDVNYVDSAEFFTALFGSDRFEHLVGELMLTAAARQGSDFQPALLKRLQLEREAELVVMLGALLRRYVEGDVDGFQESMTVEAAELATASYGDVMLAAIGGVYAAQADIFLGGILDGSLAALRAKGRGIKAQFSAASLALKVYQKQQEIAKLDALEQQVKQQQAAQAAQQAAQQAAAAFQPQQQPGDWQGPANGEHAAATTAPADAEAEVEQQQADVAAAAAAAAAAATERARLEEQSLPLMLEAMWAANKLDIQATLRHVCKRLLHDEQVSKEHRRLRAEALRELGAIFVAASRKAAAKKAAAQAAANGGTNTSTGRNGTAQAQADAAAAAAALHNPGAAPSSSGGGGSTAEQRRAAKETQAARQQQEKQRAAKDQMEAAMMAVMQKRMQQHEEDA